MSPLMSDCYVLAPTRAAGLAAQFVSRFVPDYKTHWWNPDDPREVLGLSSGASLEEIFRFLEGNPEQEYTAYFGSTKDTPPYFAILTFCEDGSLILGLSGDEDHAAARALLRQLEDFAEAKGYWSVEEAPAESGAEFLSRREHLTRAWSRRGE